jgi:hypothetical protein
VSLGPGSRMQRIELRTVATVIRSAQTRKRLSRSGMHDRLGNCSIPQQQHCLRPQIAELLQLIRRPLRKDV